ncbi:protein cysteine N palmitoyltransferase [Echinococcus multilocularis]|uniref:Protein-serine O-palmitoleoyltransferase porcupine n=1 Tax=Echinococcus multilocularis TaxID=6211 RepID=A0A087VYC0_ECHMU|nr:protein cysteine N palmitoyltransferase [Echinococcus multilocularis]
MDFGETDLTGYGGVLDEDSDIYLNNRYHYDDEMYEDGFGYYEMQDVDKGFAAFCGSIVRQVWPNIWISLIACLVWRGCQGLFRLLLSSTTTPNCLPQIFETLLNAISILLGIILLRHFFGDLYVRPCAFVFTVGFFVSSNFFLRDTTVRLGKSQTPVGWTSQMVLVTVYCLLLQLYCEFFMNRREWHMIRGTTMLLVMKAISVAASRGPDQQTLKMGFLRHYLAWCGYAFSPGSVIFGPWFGFDSYLHAIRLINPSSGNLFWKDLLRTAVSFAIAVGCIIYSTYLSSIIYAGYYLSFQWTNAYAQSQSFRFSHYFVSFFSQSLHQAIGFAALTHPNSGQNYVTAMVTNPVSIELPRSLVDVVIHWNFPMHFWLKQHIYKPTRRFGHLQALLLTYAFSSLLHGLNFQLAAVLFSIGIYAYIDFKFRERLSTKVSACIGARACPETCKHRNRANRWWVRGVNLLFSCLSIFHLAYLAVMFDTSEQQDKGYNMFHVLDKWSNLNFLSHIIASLTYLLCFLI